MLRRFVQLFNKAGKSEAKLETAALQADDGQRLHLGCGAVKLDGWINIDIQETIATDLVMDVRNISEHFEPGSVSAIQMIHAISYLRLWEARDFFRSAFDLLKPGGRLIFEFPDLMKCCAMSQKATESKDAVQQIEAIRGIFAFDLGQVEQRAAFIPYAMGWAAWHLQKELQSCGFVDVSIQKPQTHGPRPDRDSRIEATRP